MCAKLDQCEDAACAVAFAIVCSVTNTAMDIYDQWYPATLIHMVQIMFDPVGAYPEVSLTDIFVFKWKTLPDDLIGLVHLHAAAILVVCSDISEMLLITCQFG